MASTSSGHIRSSYYNRKADDAVYYIEAHDDDEQVPLKSAQALMVAPAAPDPVVQAGKPGKLEDEDAEALTELPENYNLAQLHIHEKDKELHCLFEGDSINKHKFLPFEPLNKDLENTKSKKRLLHGGVKLVHSLPALKLQTMKANLTNKDLDNFHRPKATWFPHQNEVAAKEQGQQALTRDPTFKTLSDKGSKLDAVMPKAVIKLGDTEVRNRGCELQKGKTSVDPNSVLHLVHMKVHPLPKAQRLPGDNKPTRPPSAFRRKSDLSVKDGHVALMEYCEERPLLLSNVGMGAILSTYYRKMSPADQTAVTLKEEKGAWLGAVLPLEPSEESPFLGNIRLGDTQSCLENNMYRAPIFQHQVSSTDFLLVRSPKGKVFLRRIDSIHVVGRQEPHIEVTAPSSKNVLTYLENRLVVHVFREFRSREKHGLQPQIAGEDLMAHFPSLNSGFITEILKQYADLQRSPHGETQWVMVNGFQIPSEKAIRRMVTPEQVCVYESMLAGMHHLKRDVKQELSIDVAVHEHITSQGAGFRDFQHQGISKTILVGIVNAKWGTIYTDGMATQETPLPFPFGKGMKYLHLSKRQFIRDSTGYYKILSLRVQKVYRIGNVTIAATGNILEFLKTIAKLKRKQSRTENISTATHWIFKLCNKQFQEGISKCDYMLMGQTKENQMEIVGIFEGEHGYEIKHNDIIFGSTVAMCLGSGSATAMKVLRENLHKGEEVQTLNDAKQLARRAVLKCKKTLYEACGGRTYCVDMSA